MQFIHVLYTCMCLYVHVLYTHHVGMYTYVAQPIGYQNAYYNYSIILQNCYETKKDKIKSCLHILLIIICDV